jgi:hypothetical protein
MRDAAVAAAGAVLGSLLTLLLAPARPSSDGAPSETAAALVEVRDATTLLRRALEAQTSVRLERPEATPPVASGPSPGDRTPSPSDPARGTTDGAVVGRSEERASSPIAERAPLRELLRFEDESGLRENAVDARKDGGVRARWIFASEREVVAAFGVPDEILVNENSETWTYLLPTASEDEVNRISLLFNRGRLVQVW